MERKNKSTDTALYYVTVPNQQEALNISKALLSEKLIACANMFPINSVFSWKSNVEEASEFAMILKSSKALEKKIIGRVKELHGYECPCILTFPVSSGNSDFLNWISESISNSP